MDDYRGRVNDSPSIVSKRTYPDVYPTGTQERHYYPPRPRTTVYMRPADVYDAMSGGPLDNQLHPRRQHPSLGEYFPFLATMLPTYTNQGYTHTTASNVRDEVVTIFPSAGVPRISDVGDNSQDAIIIPPLPTDAMKLEPIETHKSPLPSGCCLPPTNASPSQSDTKANYEASQSQTTSVPSDNGSNIEVMKEDSASHCEYHSPSTNTGLPQDDLKANSDISHSQMCAPANSGGNEKSAPSEDHSSVDLNTRLPQIDTKANSDISQSHTCGLADNGSEVESVTEKFSPPNGDHPTTKDGSFQLDSTPAKLENSSEPNSNTTATSIDSQMPPSSTNITSHVVIKTADSTLEVAASVSITLTPTSPQTESNTSTTFLDSSQTNTSVPSSSQPKPSISVSEDTPESSLSQVSPPQIEASTSMTGDTPLPVSESSKSSKPLDSPSQNQDNTPSTSLNKVEPQTLPQLQVELPSTNIADPPQLKENAVQNLDQQTSATSFPTISSDHGSIPVTVMAALQQGKATTSQDAPLVPPTTPQLETKALNQNTSVPPLTPLGTSSLDYVAGGQRADPGFSGLTDARPIPEAYVDIDQPPHQQAKSIEPPKKDSANFQRRDPRFLRYKQVSKRHECTGSTNSTFLPQWNDPHHHEKFKPHHRGRRIGRPTPQMPQIDFENLKEDETSSQSDDEECEPVISSDDEDDSSASIGTVPQ